MAESPRAPDDRGTGDDDVARVRHHYATHLDEDGRLASTPAFRLEQRRTRALLAQRLPAPPSSVLDVGGGTGAYASWLQDRGHDVVLVDLVPEHVDTARSRGLDARVADARELDFGPGSMDAVLVMGPLYHLVAAADRAAVLARARDIARDGGLVVAAAIARWTPLVHLASIGTWDDGEGGWSEDVAQRLAAVVHSGTHDEGVSFTAAHLHRPDELARELSAAGLVDIEVVPVEGPLGFVVDFLPDPDAALDRAIAVAEMTQHEPALAGASVHLLAFGRTPA